jgi:hypothetical protein
MDLEETGTKKRIKDEAPRILADSTCPSSCESLLKTKVQPCSLIDKRESKAHTALAAAFLFY